MMKIVALIILTSIFQIGWAQKCKDVNVKFFLNTPSNFTKSNKQFTYSTNSTHLRVPESIAFGNIGIHKFQFTKPTWSPNTELKQKLMALKTYEYKATKADFFVKIVISQISVEAVKKDGKISVFNASANYYIKLEGEFIVFDKPNGTIIQTLDLTGIAPLDIKESFEAKTIEEVNAQFAEYLDKGGKVNTLNYNDAILAAMQSAEMSAFMPGYMLIENSKISFLKDFPELDFDTYKKYAKTMQNCDDIKTICIQNMLNSSSGSLSGMSNMADARRASRAICVNTPEIQNCFKSNENTFTTYLYDYYKYMNHANIEVKTAIHTNAFYAYVYFKKYDSALIASKDLGDNTGKWYIKMMTEKLEKYKDQMDRINSFDPSVSFEKENLPKVIDMENRILTVIQEEKDSEFKNKYFDGSFIDKIGNSFKGKIYYNPYTIKFKDKQYNDTRHNVMYFLCADGENCKEFKSTDNSAMPISAALINEMTINGTKYISKNVLVKGLLKSYKNYLYTIKENDKFGFYERYANEDASKIEFVYWIKSYENPIAEDISESKLLEYFKDYPKAIEAIKNKKTSKEISETMF